MQLWRTNETKKGIQIMGYYKKQEIEKRRDDQKERLSSIFQTIKDFALPDKDNK